MYRCRRIISILLSLAVMASAFIITASADVSENYYAYLSINNTNMTIANGAGVVFTLQPGESKTITIDHIRASTNTISQYGSLAMNFSIRTYVKYTGNVYVDGYSVYPTPTSNFYSTNMNVHFRIFQDFPQVFVPNEYNLCPYGYFADFVLTDSTNHVTNCSCTWKNNTQYTLSFKYVIENLDIHTSWNYNLNYYIMPAMNGILSGITLQNTKLFSDSYSYSEINYDADGNSNVIEKSGNWITAIWGELKSLVAPVKNQVEQEQKAKDAGAYDALDDAYDHSSFWSFLDFTAFSDFGEYDSDSLDDINDDSWSRWFSNMTKNDLDSVPPTRGQDDDFISYYSAHMEEIENSVGKLIGGGD